MISSVIDLSKISHGMSRIQGGGEDTLNEVLTRDQIFSYVIVPDNNCFILSI